MGIRPQRQTVWTPAERFLKDLWLGSLEGLLGREKLHPRVLDGMSVERILVVRQHDQLGDFLLSVPALRALRARFPDAWITLAVREYFADVARLIPFVDDVIVFREDASRWNRTTLSEFWGKLRTRWDLAVVLNTVSHSLTSDLLASFSRATVTLGSSERVFPGATRNFFYNLTSPASPAGRHQSERNLDIVRYIGCTTDDLREEILLPRAEEEAARGDLLARGIAGASRPVVGLHVGAGKASNRWPAERFARLADLLEERAEARILLFWGPAEAELEEAFLRHGTSSATRMGHHPLARLAAYFRACDAVVCNDTGVMHLAAAVGAPTVALFGPTRPGEWKPAGDHVRALAGEGGEVGNIAAEEVDGAVAELLAEFGRFKGRRGG